MIGTELQDIMFGTPDADPVQDKPGRAEGGPGEHHRPRPRAHPLRDDPAREPDEPEMLKKAEEKGAKGINLAGICCTANEILTRHGIPDRRQRAPAGARHDHRRGRRHGGGRAVHLPGESDELAKCFHTKIITTSPKGKMPMARAHRVPRGARPWRSPRKIVEMAIDNFPNRGKVDIPDKTGALIAGFNHEYINYMLGGQLPRFLPPAERRHHRRPHPRRGGRRGLQQPQGASTTDIHVRVVRELIANDCLVVMTGCAAQAVAKAGLMTPGGRHDEIMPAGPAGGLRGGRHTAGAARRLLRGQQPHPHRRSRRWSTRAAWATTSATSPRPAARRSG